MIFPTGKPSRANSGRYLGPAMALFIAIAGAVCFSLVFPLEAKQVYYAISHEEATFDSQVAHRHCQGQRHHDSDIWVTPKFGDPEPRLWHNLIQWDDHPAGIRGMSLYKTKAGELELQRTHSGYWGSDYTGPIAKQERDYGAVQGEEYWYRSPG